MHFTARGPGSYFAFYLTLQIIVGSNKMIKVGIGAQDKI
jgi:hypothetical protein